MARPWLRVNPSLRSGIGFNGISQIDEIGMGAKIAPCWGYADLFMLAA